MWFCPLYSGSSGNALLIAADGGWYGEILGNGSW